MEKLHGKDIEKIYKAYGKNQSALGRASGTSKSVVLKLLLMSHGTLSMDGADTPEERGAIQYANNFVLREKLTKKQKILFDFIADKIQKNAVVN